MDSFSYTVLYVIMWYFRSILYVIMLYLRSILYVTMSYLRAIKLRNDVAFANYLIYNMLHLRTI